MAVTPAVGPYNAVALSTAQTGNADSTNTVDRGDRRGGRGDRRNNNQ